MNNPVLFLLPAPLGLVEAMWLPESERLRILHVRHFVVEAAKTARLHLKQLGMPIPIRELSLSELNEHTVKEDIPSLLLPMFEGFDLAVLSEAGCPAVADPGAVLVALAHEQGFDICPLIGPSSILMALMASGANGQRFAFHGYLPVDSTQQANVLKKLEQRSRDYDESQLFIETPYRNDALLMQCLQVLHSETRLCVSSDLSLPSQKIVSQIVRKWPEHISFHRKPSIFLIYAGNTS